mmetsp:Transcript_17165/g.27734  ORF Transcript_17165/g.27734 Transcript_17165/m.27734 type:complete len:315 (+) Transcript_17165:86-1030(+)|eukprot:CAMPEP_0203755972 /NCGR_PEP_ID=MMETSP0098-20131031/9305_1 /ASSEMBLY_ACC=CAM_ASM_000208 /TAXON_ID=96639 /ORGANISM=" , Strain NY0313808BC1" /LENGTH=314 /DNA_ID=CAMNT_0050647623 /DNA_START=69 /DNA_END=1013 /DNA_ORIENTATION=+
MPKNNGEIKRPSYRLTKKQNNHKETGSPFDRTRDVSRHINAGGHEIVDKKIDVRAFSFEKEVRKPHPSTFLRKHSGTGGKSPLEAVTTTRQQLKEREPREEESNKKKYPTATSMRPNPPNTQFRVFYERADLPVNVDQNGSLPKIAWKVRVEMLDYHHYLPLFVEGLRETELPYSFLAEEGVKDMITAGGRKILPVIPQLIIPIKTALNTRNPVVMVRVIRVLQALVVADANQEGGGLIGQALVPYYRQILPMFHLFKNCNTNIGDAIDYSQQKNDNLGDLINSALELFETHGGPDAFINIKYLVPTYQSVTST